MNQQQFYISKTSQIQNIQNINQIDYLTLLAHHHQILEQKKEIIEKAKKDAEDRKKMKRAGYIQIQNPKKFLKLMDVYFLQKDLVMIDNLDCISMGLTGIGRTKIINSAELKKNYISVNMYDVDLTEFIANSERNKQVLLYRLMNSGNKRSKEWAEILESLLQRIEYFTKMTESMDTKNTSKNSDSSDSKSTQEMPPGKKIFFNEKDMEAYIRYRNFMRLKFNQGPDMSRTLIGIDYSKNLLDILGHNPEELPSKIMKMQEVPEICPFRDDLILTNLKNYLSVLYTDQFESYSDKETVVLNSAGEIIPANVENILFIKPDGNFDTIFIYDEDKKRARTHSYEYIDCPFSADAEELNFISESVQDEKSNFLSKYYGIKLKTKKVENKVCKIKEVLSDETTETE